ncbi:cytochrome c peroxidase [Desulfuromonas sp. AOP6]|uniref:cytochrome-c peroxidase n=1 Tax=Desulfuromonas sp. AOP6 TaxID=1566351 RepID=UPI0012827144|nr:cytochrome c peroxidase [Desulfuromonas sp. AOP6]BCA78317.1 cytochrome c551 peroxidase [Desulfuromonas sp. AOP6]
MKCTMAIRVSVILSIMAFALPVLSAPLPLGLPPVPIPADNPQTPEKIALGKQLYEDKRFSSDGTVACANCHLPEKAFVDGLPVSEGVGQQKGTRNSPTVINAVYFKEQFWDGRRPSLEEQAKDPFINPVEHGLESHDPIVEIVQTDPDYVTQFEKVFGLKAADITIDHVVKAIASFERTIISGDSPFDRYQYGGDKTAMSEAAIRGLEVYLDKGRCQSCHTIGEQDALFTNNDYHNLGVGFAKIEPRMMEIVTAFRKAKATGENVDEKVLTDADVSELGRFAITLRPSDVGKFKTSGLRNIAVTAPYMHDGSLNTLEEVIDLYDRGGEANPMLDGGIRVLNLTDQEKSDLVEFLKHLTSPEYAHLANQK